MVIRITLLVAMKRIKELARIVTQLPPSPDYIAKRGPYIDGGVRTGSRMVIMYEFDKSKLTKAWENICKQRDAFYGIPGFIFSAHLLEEGKEPKEYPITLENQDMLKPPSYTCRTC